MTDPAPVVVLSTAPDAAVAERLARALVDERLAACVSSIPGVQSVFRWGGRIETAAEVLLVVKTAEDRVDALMERLRALHPYETPEILALRVSAGLDAYLAWVTATTRSEERSG